MSAVQVETKKLFLGQLVENPSAKKESEKLGVVIRVNKKTVNVAFPNGVIQDSPESFEPTEMSASELNFKHKASEPTAVGTMGYIRSKSNIPYSKANFEAGKIYKAVVTNMNSKSVSVLLFQDLDKPNATSVGKLDFDKFTKFFSTKLKTK